MIKKLVFGITFILIVACVLLYFFGTIPYVQNNLLNILYWLTLIAVIEIYNGTEIKGAHLVRIAFLVFILGGFLNILTLDGMSEFLLRIGFILWIVGIVAYAKQRLVKSKKQK